MSDRDGVIERGLCTEDFARAVGVSYRVADHWARHDTLTPSIADARGSGTARRYSAGDVAVGRVIAQLARHGAQRAVLADAVRVLRAVPEPWTGYLFATVDGPCAWCSSLEDDFGRSAYWVVRLAAQSKPSPTPAAA